MIIVYDNNDIGKKVCRKKWSQWWNLLIEHLKFTHRRPTRIGFIKVQHVKRTLFKIKTELNQVRTQVMQ